MSPFDADVERYRLIAKLPRFKKRIAKAIEIVSDALSKSNTPALSFSAGKDSVVLLDIAVRAGFRGELVFFKYGIVTDVETPRENIELLRYYAQLHGLRYTILNCLGEVDCWEQCGRFILFPETEEEKRIFRRTNYDFAQKSQSFEKEKGIDLNIIGMRKDESKRRKAVLNQKGAIYRTKSRNSVTCCPLLNFSNDDIWAYIFVNGLKYLSIYDYPYMDRRVIRNEITMLYNDAIVRHGMMFHYKRMYPHFFDWLYRQFGDIGF